MRHSTRASMMVGLTAGLASLGAGAAFGQAAPAAPPQTVVVVAATPLAGADVDARTIAAPVQTASAADIEQSHALDLTQFMNRELGSVYINDIQNNPLQPDINYRGYTASPLLGTPEGLSVFMDGERQNQPFGDIVSWDLIPREAIQSITLMPGSNPLFGLNTLGGALSIRTKSGLTAPGSMVDLSYGSYNRWQAEAATGGVANGFNWYLTGNQFKDDGWRDASPSKAGQIFGKLGWSNAGTNIALSASLADTDLTGNGLQDERLIQRDYASVYTIPDNTKNKSGQLNLTATHQISDHIHLSGDAYYRQINTRTINGDINDDSLTESVYQPTAAERTALAAAGYTGFPTSGENAANTPFPFWRCIANILLNTEPNEKCDGLLTRTGTAQTEAGVSGQATFDPDIAGHKNSFTIGGAYNESHAHFTQASQFGFLRPDRSVALVAGPGAFADGTQDSEDAFDARVDLSGRTHVASAYAAEIFDIVDTVHFSLSGRYDNTKVTNHDAITPTGDGSLTGEHSFSRFNPAVGLTFTPTDEFTAYAGYTEASRAPSAIELGCSDPDNPCRLPNALAGDPPLKQVVAHTFEVGAHGLVLGGVQWNAGVFHAENTNDILFVTDDVSGVGYFKNFGKTLRRGFEAGLSGKLGHIDLSANYTWLDATYRSEEVVGGEGNSTNDAGPGFQGNIAIEPGDHIPLAPRQIFKAGANWEASEKLSFSADMIAIGSSYARGNENNQHQPDGVFYLGPGKSGGYAVANIGAEFKPEPKLKIFLEINNVFDTHDYTAAQLGSTGFNANGSFLNRPFAGPIIDGDRPTLGDTFFSPGAPRIVWGGVRYSF